MKTLALSILFIILFTFPAATCKANTVLTSAPGTETMMLDNAGAAGQNLGFNQGDPRKKRYGVRKQPKFRSCRSAARARGRRGRH